MCISVFLSTDKQRVAKRYISSAMGAGSAKDAYRDFSDALRIEPLNEVARLYRGQLLLQVGEKNRGLEDIKVALATGKVSQQQLSDVIQNLEMSGQNDAAQAVRELSETLKKTDI
jgi:predicted Zn-dependent protease